MLNELEALLILSLFPRFGSVRIQALIRRFGSVQAILDAPISVLTTIPEFGEKLWEGWEKWKHSDVWKRELECADRYGVSLIPYTHPLYPKTLLEIPDYPLILYMQGEFSRSDVNSIAVIGTRQATVYGKEMAHLFAGELAQQGMTVVSGLARGIDTEAHLGALQKGRTIAVIGSGLAHIYPQENRGLAKRIQERGVLISEFPMNTPPDRQNFPQRNRIVSGMTSATFLVEAPLKSGAMITVEKALQYGRPVFALPGRVDMESFQGNHLLIKRQKATLVENPKEILECFTDIFAGCAVSFTRTRPLLSSGEAQFLALFPAHELSFEEILQVSGLPASQINVLITSLLLKKTIKEFPGKLYRKIN
jgi:DNA processing protein